VVDVVTKLVKLFGPKYVAIFEKHCGAQCRDGLNTDGYEEDQILSLSMLTEIIQFGGDQAAKSYAANVLNVAQQHLSSQGVSAAIRQSVCYAVGVCAAAKALDRNDTQKWLKLLKAAVDAPDSRSDENQAATENAISAIGKICKFYLLPITISNASSPNVIVDWMRMLPLVDDDEERQFCDEYLLSLLKKSSLLKDMVEGKKADLIFKLLEIMAVSIANGDQTAEEYRQLFEHLKQSCDATLLQQCVSRLPEEHSTVFQN